MTISATSAPRLVRQFEPGDVRGLVRVGDCNFVLEGDGRALGVHPDHGPGVSFPVPFDARPEGDGQPPRFATLGLWTDDSAGSVGLLVLGSSRRIHELTGVFLELSGSPDGLVAGVWGEMGRV